MNADANSKNNIQNFLNESERTNKLLFISNTYSYFLCCYLRSSAFIGVKFQSLTLRRNSVRARAPAMRKEKSEPERMKRMP